MNQIFGNQYFQYSLLILATIAITITWYLSTQKNVILFHEGEQLFLEKKFDAAISAYKSAAEAGFSKDKIHRRLGEAYTATGKFQEASTEFKAYLLRNPHDFTVRVSLARALSYMGNNEEAAKEYQEAIKQKSEIQP